jgi:hypothetical protein
MVVRVSINNMNSGRMQICCAQPSHNGYVLTYSSANAKAEVTKTLRALGISDGKIDKSLATIADFGPKEMLLVEQLEIPEEVLRRNGFVAV